MLDKTITSALLNLRAQIIREGTGGLDHVEALLQARGVDLSGHHVRRMKPSDSCKNREARTIMLNALRTGPKTAGELRSAFSASRPTVAPAIAMVRSYQAVYRMRRKGLVVKDGDVWRLA